MHSPIHLCTQLQQLDRASKVFGNMYATKMVVVGVLNHGQRPRAIANVFPSHVAKDSSLTCHLLSVALQHASRCNPEYYQSLGQLDTRVLYLQMDNATSENKNKLVVGFCGLLVLFGLFSKVKISFLPVGHTHEDVDQMFSCFSRGLKNQSVLAPSALKAIMRKAFNANGGAADGKREAPLVLDVESPLYWKAMLESKLEQASFAGITRIRCLKVFKNSSGTVVLQSRKTMSQSRNWVGSSNGRPLKVFSAQADITRAMFVDNLLPSPTKPLLVKELQASVDLCKKNKSSGWKEEYEEEWDTFLDKHRSDDACKKCVELQHTLIKNGSRKSEAGTKAAKTKAKEYRKAKRELMAHAKAAHVLDASDDARRPFLSSLWFMGGGADDLDDDVSLSSDSDDSDAARAADRVTVSWTDNVPELYMGGSAKDLLQCEEVKVGDFVLAQVEMEHPSSRTGPLAARTSHTPYPVHHYYIPSRSNLVLHMFCCCVLVGDVIFWNFTPGFYALHMSGGDPTCTYELHLGEILELPFVGRGAQTAAVHWWHNTNGSYGTDSNPRRNALSPGYVVRDRTIYSARYANKKPFTTRVSHEEMLWWGDRYLVLTTQNKFKHRLWKKLHTRLPKDGRNNQGYLNFLQRGMTHP